MRLLFIETQAPAEWVLRRKLEAEGFAVDLAHGLPEGNHKAGRGEYEVIILDLSADREEAIGLLPRWRKAGVAAHILVLTGAERDADRVRALDQGADDGLSRPFSVEELLARLRALLRRTHRAKSPVLRIHDLEIDTVAHEVKRGGRVIRLTRREYALLHLLAVNRGRTVSRTMIWDHMYDPEDQNTSNVIDVYIRYLRNKIDKGFPLPLILTRRGEGYLLRSEEVRGQAM